MNKISTILCRKQKTGGEVSVEAAQNSDLENDTGEDTQQATVQAEDVTEAVKGVLLVLDGDLKRAEIQEILGLKDRVNFIANYLNPSLNEEFIEMTIPEIPTHQEQRYRLTDKGKTLRTKLLKPRKKK